MNQAIHDPRYLALADESPEQMVLLWENFFKQVKLDPELKRLAQIMKKISTQPESTTISIRPHNFWAAPDK